MAPRVCSACTGQEFRLNEGFMYCITCGTLFEHFTEMDDDDLAKVGRAKVKIKTKRKIDAEKTLRNLKLKPKTILDTMREEVKSSECEFFRDQASTSYKKIFALNRTPAHIYRLGIRLTCFAELLARCAAIMVDEFGFPEALRMAPLAIFEKYLQHCQVAFGDSETTDDPDEQFVAILENENYEAEREAERLRKAAERKEKARRTLMETQDAWHLLTQGNLTENLELDEDDDEDDNEMELDETTNHPNDRTMGIVRRIETRMSKRAMFLASQVVLNVEILAAIVHLACLSIGCRNVMLSDVVRWIREDRFHISDEALVRIQRGGHEKWNKPLRQGELATFLDAHAKHLQLPLYEIYRTELLLVQSVDLRANVCDVSFAKIAARLIDNLNLPTHLIRRLILLESILKCDLSTVCRRQLDVRNGRNLSELTRIEPRMRFDDLMTCFGRIDSNFKDTMRDEVLLTIETKVMAYILLALRLTIDVDTEHVVDYDDVDGDFDIDTYIHQLEMRISCQRGHAIAAIIKTNEIVAEMHAKTPFGDNVVGQLLETSSTQNLPTVFMIRRATDSREPSALLSPLKHQTSVLREEMSKNAEHGRNCSQQSLETFFKSFSNCKLGETSANFSNVFPASNNYPRYSRPIWLAKVASKTRKRFAESGNYRIHLTSQVIRDVYLSAESTFSRRFKFILESFALILGEDVEALYAAFSLLETALIENEKLMELKRDLLESTPIPVRCLSYSKSGDHVESRAHVMPAEPLTSIDDLDQFVISFSSLGVELPDMTSSSDSEFDDDDDDDDNLRRLLKSARFRHSNSRNRRQTDDTNRTRSEKRVFEFDTIWRLLYIKYW
ncbi:unnamed protein product [Caenorhabditis bovis]|uniref:TATA box-binding protein-associated factor 1B n=1 Tax=Caenorhabditis bovis TaxID=2654633 RepID=A0A8S1ELK5_9PELO|nr:unnamed protein product [Caenorhabditis bovis]